MKNDTVDKPLVRRLMNRENKATALDEVAEKSSRAAVSVQVNDGFALRDASPSTWQLFIEHDFWKAHPNQRPTSVDQANAVKYVLRVHFGDANRAPKRASDYWIAVQQLLAEKMTAQQVVGAIKKGDSINSILKRKRSTAALKPKKVQPKWEADQTEKPVKTVAKVTQDGATLDFRLDFDAKSLRAISNAVWPSTLKIRVTEMEGRGLKGKVLHIKRAN